VAISDKLVRKILTLPKKKDRGGSLLSINKKISEVWERKRYLKDKFSFVVKKRGKKKKKKGGTPIA